MKNSEILGMVISAKLDMAARLTERLPGDMGKKLEEAGETVNPKMKKAASTVMVFAAFKLDTTGSP